MDWSANLQQRAQAILPKDVYDFIAGGADNESVLQRNITAFEQLALVPRILANVRQVNIHTNLCGTALSSPIIIAPTAPHKLLHPMGEFATVKAAKSTDTLMIVSCMASETLEDIAQTASADLWFQLHIFRDRQVTENLAKRAVVAGYQALVITVDMPLLGERRRDVQNQFKIPDACLAANLVQEGLIQPSGADKAFKSKHANYLFDSAVTWEDIQWLQKCIALPIILKGILHPEDAI